MSKYIKPLWEERDFSDDPGLVNRDIWDALQKLFGKLCFSSLDFHAQKINRIEGSFVHPFPYAYDYYVKKVSEYPPLLKMLYQARNDARRVKYPVGNWSCISVKRRQETGKGIADCCLFKTTDEELINKIVHIETEFAIAYSHFATLTTLLVFPDSNNLFKKHGTTLMWCNHFIPHDSYLHHFVRKTVVEQLA